ncbi:MAG: DUF4349 domain-containing protein [Spirochaetales bacterium]|nr:DUF4349 domain-containing protein [Spirochaetales bacterium]
MKKSMMLLFFLLLSLPVFAESSQRHVEVHATLRSLDVSRSAQSIVEWTSEVGGYFVWSSDESVRLRIPAEKVSQLQTFLKGLDDVLLDYGLNQRDLRESFDTVQETLQLRLELLERMTRFMEDADYEGTLEIEREIRRLLDGIDSLKGQLRRLNHDQEMALADVRFESPAPGLGFYRSSSFEWINETGVYDLLERPLDPPSFWAWNRIGYEPPQGFALLRSRGDLLALSPEGMRFSLRVIHKIPQKDWEFWSKVLSDNFQRRGYRPTEIQPQFTEEYSDFHFSSWLIPWNGKTQLYTVGIFCKASTIQLIEFVGSEQILRERDDLIL